MFLEHICNHYNLKFDLKYYLNLETRHQSLSILVYITLVGIVQVFSSVVSKFLEELQFTGLCQEEGRGAFLSESTFLILWLDPFSLVERFLQNSL